MADEQAPSLVQQRITEIRKRFPEDPIIVPPLPSGYESVLKIRSNSKNPNLKFNFEKQGIGKYLNPKHSPFPYQVVGVFVMLKTKRMNLGDGTGLGKTFQTVWSYCVLKETEGLKMIVVATKSALYQWKEEIEGQFDSDGTLLREGAAKGIKAHVLRNEIRIGKGREGLLTSVKAREYQYKAVFGDPNDPNDKGRVDVLIMNYSLMQRDKDLLMQYVKKTPYMVVFDEITTVKNHKSQTHEAAWRLSVGAARCYGLTATLLKNNLIEGFGIYNIIYPATRVDKSALFTNITRFRKAFCKENLLELKDGRIIPQIIGYKNVEFFRYMIDPYYIGRFKHEVSDQLPTLTTKDLIVEMGDEQEKVYKQAFQGTFFKDDGQFVETTPLTKLIYLQQLANAPAITGVNAPSAKEEELLRFMNDEMGFRYKNDEAPEQDTTQKPEKVIIFTIFKSWIDRLQKLFEERGVNVCRITGDESAEQRHEYKNLFTRSPDHNLIFINLAGSESINLQAASTIIFLDIPWSYGDYLQLLGRLIRIGSQHQKVLAVHLMTKKTLDTTKLRRLKRKKSLIDEAMGQSQLNALEFDQDKELADLVEEMRREYAQDKSE